MPRRQSNQKWKAQVQQERRQDAEKRQAIRDARSIDEQLDILANRPGESMKEKTRLITIKEVKEYKAT